jgi:translation initiation factor 1 (eIF-1/SUI1)
VKLTVVLRSGNKKVTVVSNLEHYGINCDSFASRLQKMAAASTSVSEIPSGQKIEKIVSIQGDATKLLTQQLTDVFGLPSKYIEQESKIKKKGK